MTILLLLFFELFSLAFEDSLATSGDKLLLSSSLSFESLSLLFSANSVVPDGLQYYKRFQWNLEVKKEREKNRIKFKSGK